MEVKAFKGRAEGEKGFWSRETGVPMGMSVGWER